MKRVKPGKTAKRRDGSDDLRPEYDFSRARPNKYAARSPRGSIVVTLDPDVAAVFPGALGPGRRMRLSGLSRG